MGAWAATRQPGPSSAEWHSAVSPTGSRQTNRRDAWAFGIFPVSSLRICFGFGISRPEFPSAVPLSPPTGSGEGSERSVARERTPSPPRGEGRGERCVRSRLRKEAENSVPLMSSDRSGPHLTQPSPLPQGAERAQNGPRPVIEHPPPPRREGRGERCVRSRLRKDAENSVPMMSSDRSSPHLTQASPLPQGAERAQNGPRPVIEHPPLHGERAGVRGDTFAIEPPTHSVVPEP